MLSKNILKHIIYMPQNNFIRCDDYINRRQVHFHLRKKKPPSRLCSSQGRPAMLKFYLPICLFEFTARRHVWIYTASLALSFH